jgi:hypothetical protein
MNANGVERVNAEHQAAWENLPWYVNGTLRGADLDRLERHVESCVACRGELRYLRELGGLVHAAEDFPLAAAASLSKVMDRIDAAEGGGEGSRRSRRRPEPTRRAAPGIRVALIAQAAMILLLIGILAWSSRAPSAEFRTLSDPPAAPADDGRPRLRLVFDPGTPELRIREILTPLGAEIVAGPTALGVYTVALPGPEPGGATVDDVLEGLREHAQIRFAERATTL